jgi:hypothetical protein
LLALRAESATRPPPRFRSCSIAITAYRRAVTEQLDTLNAAETEGDRGLGAALGAFESCVVGRPAAQRLLPSQRQDSGRRQSEGVLGVRGAEPSGWAECVPYNRLFARAAEGGELIGRRLSPVRARKLPLWRRNVPIAECSRNFRLGSTAPVRHATNE